MNVSFPVRCLRERFPIIDMLLVENTLAASIVFLNYTIYTKCMFAGSIDDFGCRCVDMITMHNGHALNLSCFL